MLARICNPCVHHYNIAHGLQIRASEETKKY